MPNLLIPICGAYVPGPGTAPLIMTFAGSRKSKVEMCQSISKDFAYSYRQTMLPAKAFCYAFDAINVSM